MSGMRTRLDRATEYRRLALAATALVESSLLANVREKHELAAARWTDLAELAERSTAPRLAQGATQTPMVELAEAAVAPMEPPPGFTATFEQDTPCAV